MNYQTYLLKSAMTTPKLYAMAKRQGMPLLGDWRYATKLMAKAERAQTPQGIQKLTNAVGLVRPDEQAKLRQMQGLMQDPTIEYGLGYTKDKNTLFGSVGDKDGVDILHGGQYQSGMPRTVHTHPDISSYAPPHRQGIGQVFPSSDLDVSNLSLDQGLSAIKRNRPMAMGSDLTYFGQQAVTNPRNAHTGVIASPTQGMQSVTKIRNNKVNRFYMAPYEDN